MVEVKQKDNQLIITIDIPTKVTDLELSDSEKTHLLSKDQITPIVNIGGKKLNFRGNVLLYTKDIIKANKKKANNS